MKLQIMSSSHMQVDAGCGQEYGRFDFPVAAPNLALLGGMGRVCDQELLDFIVHQLERFERVFYVLGADEFYGSDFPTTIRTMRTFAKKLADSTAMPSSDDTLTKKLGTFHLLHRARFDLEDITVLGCTLWRHSTDYKHEKRENASHGFRPIKDFYAEDEQAERELDIAWLESELDACANGEGPVLNTQNEESGDDPSPPVEEYVEEDEGDIYNDVPMSPPPQPTSLPVEPPSDDSQVLAIYPAENTGSTSGAPIEVPKPRKGPARRVLVMTYFPPTYNETTHPRWKPTNYKVDNVETLLKNRQCWATPNGAGNGVSVQSPLHGDSAPSHTEDIPPSQPNDSDHDVEACSHDEIVDTNSDPLRPPGLAAWAFGCSGWSCDVQYDVNKPKPPEPERSYYNKKPATPPPPHDLPCPSCGRVPTPVRIVSNQRGQQWKRNLQPYVDVPVTWRAFDDAFVIDV
ncbi:hypothetical protein FRC09_013233 [Ceratobasidium sp. 395]|nr:hypothetical protein FRC09_013233 [Ceratobasidium sp. 395]